MILEYVKYLAARTPSRSIPSALVASIFSVVAHAQTPPVSVSPTNLSFGTAVVGSTTPIRVATLRNTGSSAVSISGVGLSGAVPDDFALTTNCGAVLAGGASCAANITFKPLSAGPKAATFVFKDSASVSPQSVSLTGSGVRGALGPGVPLSPTALTFSNEAVG